MQTLASPASDPGPGASRQLAAIDMGSNSFRLEIGQLQDGRYRRIDYLKETVRLGAGLDDAGLLDEEAAMRGLDCLARFARRLDGVPAAQVRAVATQTLREAKNRDLFLVRAEQALGRPIEVISGREEARLIFAGVARLQPSTLPRLVVDIGGRSTEMILGQGPRPLRAESFQIGSVSLSMKYFPDGRFTKRRFHEAQVAAGAELEEALEPFAARHWKEALGSSGTVGAVSQILAAAGISDGRVTPAGLQWLMERCLEAGSADRLDLPGLKEERRAVIGGGLAILYTLAAHFGIVELMPARGALRQGVIFDLDARHALERRAGGEDLREQSVRELQKRFGVDVAQAGRVTTLATSLLTSAVTPVNPEAGRELAWTAALHEAGMMVSHHDHHRHSAYMLTHVDAPGFSQNQLQRMGELALGQRGGLRKLEGRLQDTGFALRLLCLRLAVIVCHAREPVDPGVVTLQQGADEATIGIDPDWARTHPRALHLLREEVAAWTKVKTGARPPRLIDPEG